MEDRYLFKAKRVDNGEWVVGSLISMPYGGYMIDRVADSRRFGVMINPSTICQCTGLKDENGKLIWENDIMAAYLDDDYPEDETYIRILWRGSGFWSKEKGSEDMLQVDEFDQEHFEVIGNIFDNPELLGNEE